MRSGTMLNEDGEYVAIHPSIIKSYVGLYSYSPVLKESVEILKILMIDENPIFFCVDRTKEEKNFHVFELHEISIHLL